MALDMTNATYGRSTSGKSKLYTDFCNDIENIIKVLNGDKYATFKRTVTENWVGVDADDFMADIEKTRVELQSKLRALKTRFYVAIDNDARQFASFQQKNVK